MKPSKRLKARLNAVVLANYLEMRENEKINGCSNINSTNQQMETWIRKNIAALIKLGI